MNKEKKLTEFELILWIVVREKLRHIVAQTFSKAKFFSEPGTSVFCLKVRADRKRYGFCSILHLLGDRDYRAWGGGLSAMQSAPLSPQEERIRRRKVEAKITALRRTEKKKIGPLTGVLKKLEDISKNIKFIKKKILNLRLNIRRKNEQKRMLWWKIRALHRHGRKIRRRKNRRIFHRHGFWHEQLERRRNQADTEKAKRMLRWSRNNPILQPLLENIIAICGDINLLLAARQKRKQELRFLKQEQRKYKRSEKEINSISEISARYYNLRKFCLYNDFRCRTGFIRNPPRVVHLNLLTMPCGNDRRTSLCSQYVRILVLNNTTTLNY